MNAKAMQIHMRSGVFAAVITLVFALLQAYRVANAIVQPPLPSGWVEVPGDGRTNGALATTQFEGKVYVFAIGLDGGIWLQTYDYDSRTWLDAWMEVPGGGVTDAAPAATSTADTLYLFVKGLDNQVWVNKKGLGGGPTDGWSGWRREFLAGETTTSVAAVADKNGLVYVFRRGTDGQVYFSQTPFGHVPWTKVLLTTTIQAPAAAYDDTTDTVFVFGVGAYTQEVRMNSYREGEWKMSPCKVPGAETSKAVAAAAGSGRLYLFHTGKSNNRLYAQTYGGTCGVWSGRAELKGGGTSNASPAATLARVTSSQGGRFMVFGKGIEVNGIYYHRRFSQPHNSC